MEKLLRFFTSYINVFKINDFIDIIIITFVIYWLIKVVKETRAVQLLRGIIVIVAALQLSAWFNLNVVNFVLSKTIEVGLLALVIIFQPELRHALEKVGTTSVGDFFPFTGGEQSREDTENAITEIADACQAMSATKTGALIVLERKSRLNDVVATGTKLDCVITKEVLGNIFYPKTPLHDGAVVISNNRIKAAGCLLPLTQNTALPSELGTRHRAALGMSEYSDAIVIVVSEETGKISIARKGMLTRNYDRDSLKRALSKLLITLPEEQARRRKLFSRKGGRDA